MIQRIQSVYLFFVFCLMATLVFVPFTPCLWVLSDAVLIAVLATIALFLYKNRKLQIRISYVLLFLLILMYAFYFIFNRQNLQIDELIKHTRFTFVFPLIAFVFVYLAVRGIKKDEKLVRSLDRLR